MFREDLDLEQYLELALPCPKLGTSRPRTSRCPGTRGGFFSTGSFEEAEKLVKLGWKEKPNLGKLAEEIAGKPELAMKHDVSGSIVDMGRFIAGHPENMIQFTEEPTKRVLNLGFSISYPASTQREEIENRGAVLVALYESFVAQGYLVNIWFTDHSLCKKGGQEFFTRVKMHSSDRPLDLDSIAFWTCHSDALRRIHFSRIENFPEELSAEAMANGYGGPMSASEGCDIYLGPKSFPASKESARRLFDALIEDFKQA